MMLTEGVRNDDGTIRALGGEIYDPKRHKADLHPKPWRANNLPAHGPITAN